MIGSSITNAPPKTFRLESKLPKSSHTIRKKNDPSSDSISSANSLGEWARTYDIEPLQQKREQIHKEKREGKAVDQHLETGRRASNPSRGAPNTPTKEYLSKLFEASPSQYSNFEVKQMYAAAKSADQNVYVPVKESITTDSSGTVFLIRVPFQSKGVIIKDSTNTNVTGYTVDYTTGQITGLANSTTYTAYYYFQDISLVGFTLKEVRTPYFKIEIIGEATKNIPVFIIENTLIYHGQIWLE